MFQSMGAGQLRMAKVQDRLSMILYFPGVTILLFSFLNGIRLSYLFFKTTLSWNIGFTGIILLVVFSPILWFLMPFIEQYPDESRIIVINNWGGIMLGNFMFYLGNKLAVSIDE